MTRVAVLSVTRDRLFYTKHCFQTLRDNAGCDFDHFVLDNESVDGTLGWLVKSYPFAGLTATPTNIGLCPALNALLEKADPSKYDVIVRFDNDCEVTQSGTLKAMAELANDYGMIVAPKVNWLLQPPPVIGLRSAGAAIIEETNILGGIFMAIPAMCFTDHGFRYDESNPPYTGDEAIVPWWREKGGVCGYVRGWNVNHYERVVEQREFMPEYQQRKEREMAA